MNPAESTKKPAAMHMPRRAALVFVSAFIKAQSQLALASLLQKFVYQSAESAGVGVAASRILVSRRRVSWRWGRCCKE